MASRKIDRFLLAAYLAALLGLLILPISATQYQLLGVGSDKFMHSALFGGLAVLLRWNLSKSRHALFISVGAAFAVIVATEVVQGLIAYRSADLWDVLAGLVGAVLGVASADRILASVTLQKLLGPVVVTVGLMVGVFFLLADAIGVGNNAKLGILQIAGMILGALIALGGAQLYATASRASTHRH